MSTIRKTIPRPGNAFTTAPASNNVIGEPRNKVLALQNLVRAIPDGTPHKLWLQHCVNTWAGSTGSSLAHLMGLHRRGYSPHTVAFIETRNDQVRMVAAHLPGSTNAEKAAQLVDILEGNAPPPSARVKFLTSELVRVFAGHLPTEDRQYLRILAGDGDDAA